jgi:hypothetical protein
VTDTAASRQENTVRNVSLGSEGFEVDGRGVPLVAAQFEYFRHNAIWWPRCLDAIKQAGIDLVSIFICWDFHEPEQGQFDFTGATNASRDLAGFLDLCAERDLMVLVRPGPIIDAEWETRGPAKDVMTLDRLHPRFLERTRQYINAVCEVLAPAQAVNGGPVVLLGVDNEILYPYNTPESQFAVDGDVYIPYDSQYYDAAFRAWLQDEYGSVEKLNNAVRTGFQTWDDVRAPKYRHDHPAYSFESFRFLNSQIAAFTRICRDMYRAAGMTVPAYTNMKQLLAYIDWPAVGPELDSIGMNLCMPRDMPGQQAMVANWWYRLHRARFPFSWAAEFQSGWIGLDDNFGFISEDHSEYMPMAAQAAGLRGLNFYMFVERDDWSYAPVNLTGKIRPGRYERFKRVVASYQGLPATDEHLADIGLLWSLEDHQSIYLYSDADWSTLPDHWLRADEAKAPPQWWQTFQTLVAHDLDFRLWIPGVSPGRPPKLLVHAGLPTATPDYVKAVADLAEDCEALIAVTPLPTRTLAGDQDESMASSVNRISAAGRLVASTADQVAADAAALGAVRYAWSGTDRVWTYLYRNADGSKTLGVWNARDEAFDGPVRLDSRAFGSPGQRWRVEEPRMGSAAALERAPGQFEVSLPPHAARVFRFFPE